MPLPDTQYAVQLVGPDELLLNAEKPVHRPNPYQVLGRVEAVGLCFSDLKLLKQFSRHPRKTPILSGIEPSILDEIPSYVPGEKPGVPGHEAVIRLVAVGDRVQGLAPGGRYLVQTDYRWLPTAESNGSFGYTFEGGLQEYVLLDQRVFTSPAGECMLIPVGEELSSSAVALVEPWACVEDAYATRERRLPLEGGRLLVAGNGAAAIRGLDGWPAEWPRPARITWCADAAPPAAWPFPVATAGLDDLPDGGFEDVLYFGCDADLLESVFPKLAARGLLNIALCSGAFGRPVAMPVGRVHYGGIRVTGTPGSDAREGYRRIPASGEVRPGDRVHVIGAGGPMGIMHVIRTLCLDVPGLQVLASARDANRRAGLHALASGLAEAHGVPLHIFDPREQSPGEVHYVALMAPVPALVAEALQTAAPGAIINIFAGIPADVLQPLDLDAYVRHGMYFIGTSGSVIDDMRAVLDRISSGRLDTNLSVAAVSGPEGAIDGLRAVEHRTIDGKIVVYPACHGLGLTCLEDLGGVCPVAADALREGRWTPEAETRLREAFSQSVNDAR